MSIEQNKAILRRLVEEFWNQGNLDVADELFTPDAASPSAPMLPPGPDGVKLIGGMMRAAFPDFHMTITMMAAEGDLVMAYYTEEGTHLGEWLGVKPTGRRVKFNETGIIRIAGGKIAECWFVTDMLGLMQQLGALPSMDAAA
jgi:predicted ester cyclase